MGNKSENANKNSDGKAPQILNTSNGNEFKNKMTLFRVVDEHK